jgi:alpha-L-rhamnosidase
MMFGEIGAWFFKGLGGIFPDPAQPGFRHIILRPNMPDELDHFEATFQSPYGLIVSAWKREKKHIVYQVTVPANSTATLSLPDDRGGIKMLQLDAGEHTFNIHRVN